MGNGYLTKETIASRYDNLNDFIRGGRNIVLIYGIAFSTLSFGKSVEEFLIGGGIALGSYYTGKFLSGITMKRKENVLNKTHRKEEKSLEEKAVA